MIMLVNVGEDKHEQLVRSDRSFVIRFLEARPIQEAFELPLEGHRELQVRPEPAAFGGI